MRNKYISKFKLHSIPILHRSKCLRYVSYSIPLTCSLALLLLIGNLFCLFSKTPEVFADSIGDSIGDSNTGITTYATTSVNPTATLTIENSHLDTIASPGTINYVSSKVDVSASDITGYSLILSGPESLSGSTPISGAGGKTPTTMADNSWGYAWTPVTSDEDSNTNSTYTYNTLNPNGSNIKDNFTDTKVTNFSVNFSRQLTFAAKFAEDATSGHYKANVTLSLAATPREVATGFNGIYDMQEMTTNICKTAQKGLIGSLEDTRDSNVYTVAKLDDDNCWMTKNLSLALWDEENDTPITLTPEDSNVKEDWVSTSGKSERWKNGNCTAGNTDANGCDVVRYYNGDQTAKWQLAYGYYYTWGAATAGQAAEISSGNATQDVCPKGWELPSNSQYALFLRSISADDTSELTVSPYNYVLSGMVHSGGDTSSIGDDGEYWSRSTINQFGAGALDFNTAGAMQATVKTDYARTRGRTIRCIAKDDDTRTLNDITTMQEMTPQICENTPIGATQYHLKDARDNKTYTVAKHEDGKCWMTSNLALALWDEEKNQAVTLTSDDSNVSNNWQSTTGPSEIVKGLTCTANDTKDCNIAMYYDGSETTEWKEDYGYYYTWGAATAGTGAQITGSYQDAVYDICPKGWHLMRRSEFQKLWTAADITDDAAGAEKLLSPPYNFVKAGRFNYASGDHTYKDNAILMPGTSVNALYQASDAVITTTSPYDGTQYRWVGTSPRAYETNIRCVAY